MIAAIEMGGTKTVVAVGESDGTVLEEFRYPTTDGPGTFARAVAWLQERGTPSSLGIAAFGPVSVRRARPDYGSMLATPKPGWAGYSIMDPLSRAFPDTRVVIETDVNAAVLAEAAGLDDVVYITIGTGLGAGILSGGQLLHGVLHSEFGHWFPRRASGDDFPGVCPFHGDCLEGLASGPAIEKRWGREAKDLPPDHLAWTLECDYLAQAVQVLLATVNPARVVIGGGVSQVDRFHSRIEQLVRERTADYFPALAENQPFVVPPQFEQQAGIRGALLLTQLSGKAE